MSDPVQQNISSFFRSMEGRQICRRVRSYLSACRKQGLTASHALSLFCQGKCSDFMTRHKDQWVCYGRMG